jgi:hypothetical protein
VATKLDDLLPRNENLSSDHLLGKFLDYVEGRRLTLYEAQEEAVLEPACRAAAQAGCSREKRHPEHAHRLGQIARDRRAYRSSPGKGGTSGA